MAWGTKQVAPDMHVEITRLTITCRLTSAVLLSMVCNTPSGGIDCGAGAGGDDHPFGQVMCRLIVFI